MVTSRSARLMGLGLSILLLLPSVVWIASDSSAFGGDQSQYGFATLDLYHTLRHAPGHWPAQMLSVFPAKPNGLIWLGQIFLPLATIWSVDRTLLLVIVTLQMACLWLFFCALNDGRGRLGAAVVACLVVGGAPLFVLFAHHYLVETFQTTAVAWFVLIACRAATWDRLFLVAQLIAATAFALAAKELQPLFCILPGLAATWTALKPGQGAWRVSLGAGLTLLVSSPLVGFTAMWYVRNYASVLAHLHEGAYGEGVKHLWGKEDTYFNTLAYWSNTAREVPFLPGFGILFGVVLLTGIVAAIRHRRPSSLSFPATVSALQIVLVILVFSLSPTRQPRYLLPIVPYLGLLMAWALGAIGNSRVTALVGMAFALQFAAVHAQALGVGPTVSQWIAPVQHQAVSGRIMDSIGHYTCSPEAGAVPWNVIAVDPSVPAIGGDWLAPDPANYWAAKQRFATGGELACHYGYLGDGFFGAEIERAWQGLLQRQARWVIVLDSLKYPPPELTFNQTLSRSNEPELMRRLNGTGDFELESRLPEDSGVLLYRRTDRLHAARSLVDRGAYAQGIMILREMTSDEPDNVEAWANLVLALSLSARDTEAVDAGRRALTLSPDHYYVNLLLAQVESRMGLWSQAYAHAAIAATHSQSRSDEIVAARLAGEAAIRNGDTVSACTILRRASVTGADLSGTLAEACGP